MLEIILSFAFGILFTQIIIPIISAITDLFLTWIELLKVHLTEKITNSNIKMKKVLSDAGDEPLITETRTLGFGAPAEEYTIEENEEDDNEV